MICITSVILLETLVITLSECFQHASGLSIFVPMLVHDESVSERKVSSGTYTDLLKQNFRDYTIGKGVSKGEEIR